MTRQSKTLQLQIRVSPQEKAAIRRYAKEANIGLSQWILDRIFPPAQQTFQDLLARMKNAPDPKNVFAEINDLLTAAAGDEFDVVVSRPPPESLSDYQRNYVAAMVECAAVLKGRKAPPWVENVLPLKEPVFGSDLQNLRLYLLTHSPPPFRRRNIFIDSTIGKRV